MATVVLPVQKQSLSVRFYKEVFPDADDAVIATVTEIGEMGAYVKLLEYNNIPGMILLSELSRRRIRSINKLVRVGRDECAVVVRVDKDKGYIDLSKRRLSEDEKRKCENRYEKAKHVNSIVTYAAELAGITTNEDLEEFMEKTAWYFDVKYKRAEEPHRPSYNKFKECVDNEDVLDELDITAEQKAALVKTIRQRLTPQPKKLRAEIEVTCYEYEGVDAIKAALSKGLECSTEQVPIKIQLYAPPLYFITTTTNDQKHGVEVLNQAMDKIQAEIENLSGRYELKKAPFIDEVEAVLPPSDSANVESEETESEDDEN